MARELGKLVIGQAGLLLAQRAAGHWLLGASWVAFYRARIAAEEARELPLEVARVELQVGQFAGIESGKWSLGLAWVEFVEKSEKN